jgi:hypothetical protein
MPRGNPGKLTALRLEPALLAAVKEHASNLTRAVEEGLRLWLARERRKAAKARPDPLARHLGPPTAREIAARRKDDAE